MNLVWNWKTVLSEAWSIRLGLVSALLGGVQQAMTTIPAGFFGLSPEVWTVISGVLGAISVFFAALVVPARLVDQGLTKGVS